MRCPQPPPAEPSRRPGFPAARLGALLLPALLAASCMNGAQEEAFFRLEADPVLMTYGRVVIGIGDTLGNQQATLYDDSLPSLARLFRLPAGPYRGGTVRITILGYRQGTLAYRETRLYDGRSERSLSVEVFKVDAPADPGPALPEPDPVPDPAAVGGRAPGFDSRAGDTVVSIKDSVYLAFEAFDADGDLAGFSWDCDGDGDSDGGAALAGYRAKIRPGCRFPDSGSRRCALRVWDGEGHSVLAEAGIRVEQDPPWADAGADTLVTVGTAILLHARGADGLGPIVSREWKIGSLDFLPVPKQETTRLAPDEPGDLMCILRVTDSDSLSALDTMMVKVVLPER